MKIITVVVNENAVQKVCKFLEIIDGVEEYSIQRDDYIEGNEPENKERKSKK